MIRAGNILELFKDPSKSYEIHWNVQDDFQWDGDTTIDDGRTFRIVIHRPDVENLSLWDFEFFVGNEVGVTGKGDALRIMTTIIKIAFQFLLVKLPEILVFTIEEESRVRLYNRALRDIAFTGYQMYKSHNQDKVYYIARSEKDFING